MITIKTSNLIDQITVGTLLVISISELYKYSLLTYVPSYLCYFALGFLASRVLSYKP